MIFLYLIDIDVEIQNSESEEEGIEGNNESYGEWEPGICYF